MDLQDRPQRRRKSVTHYSDDNPSTFTIKRKRGDKSFSPPTAAVRKKASATTSNTSTTTTTTTRKRKLRVVPEAPPPLQDTILSHAVSIEPILPLNLLANASSTASTTCDALQSLPHPPRKPTWSSVVSAYSGILLQRQYVSASVVQVPPPAVSCWTCYQNQFAVGDVAGGVVLYTTHSRTLPLARLHTRAWHREQTRILDSKKTISYPNAVQHVVWRHDSIVLQTSQEIELFVIGREGKWNEHAVRTVPLRTTFLHVWSGNLDVYSTTTTTTTTTHRILWATGGRECSTDDGNECITKSEKSINGLNGKRGDDDANTEDAVVNTLLQITVDDANMSIESIQPTQVSTFTVLTAIWDAALANLTIPTLLAVAWTNSDTVELVRCEAANQTILQRTEGWPLSSSANTLVTVTSTYCHIQQYSKFTFLVGGFKGIKVLDTATLACVQIIGESVSLHGKTVQWQSVECIRRPRTIAQDERIRRHKKQEWIERADEVLRRLEETNDRDDDDDDYWLIGVPSPYKGPEEMKSTLHVWKRGIPNPIVTLQAPAGGCLGFSAQCDSSGWTMFCATAEFGEIWEWKSSMVSDFAGVMYPVGYQVVDDNIEYIEDEDELDQLVVSENMEERNEPSKMLRGRDVSQHDEDLMRALELSLQEQKKKDRDESSSLASHVPPIDILNHDSPSHSELIPCNPDLVLVRNEADQQTNSPKSPILSPQRRDGFESEVLLELPQTKQVRQTYARLKQQQEALAQSATVLVNASSIPLPPRLKGKRTKVANVEVLLQSCVNPNLRTFMGTQQACWSSGDGCHVSKAAANGARRSIARQPKEVLMEKNNGPVDEKELAMELLFLGPGRSASMSPNTSQGSESSVAMPETQVSHPTQANCSVNNTCAACRGRMVFHSCGRREKPVDYEAIERAEREQKEREAEERNKQRVEKRRAADAKRREERKKKKDEEARVRMEEEQKRRGEVERMQQLEADQFDEAHIREDAGNVNVGSTLAYMEENNDRPSSLHSSSFNSVDRDFQQEHRIAHAQAYTTLEEAHNNRNSHLQVYDGLKSSPNSAHAQANGMFEEQRSHSSYHSVDYGHQDSFRSEVSSIRLETIRIDGAEVKPYQTISGEDALAALAGLADMAAAVSTEESTPEYSDATFQHNNDLSRQTDTSSSAPASWYMRESESGFHSNYPDPGHHSIGNSEPVEATYVYRGSQDRRTAIAQAFLGSFCAGGNGIQPSFDGTVPLNSINYNELAKNSFDGTDTNKDKNESQEEGNLRNGTSTWEQYQG
jgi:hypothetical protein